MTLCVGGPLDGQWVESSRDTMYSYNTDTLNPCAEMLVYDRVQLSGSTEKFNVFVLRGMNGDALVEALIKGYKNAQRSHQNCT